MSSCVLGSTTSGGEASVTATTKRRGATAAASGGGSSSSSSSSAGGAKPGLLYVLQGVRDREAIKSASEAEAEKALAAVGLRAAKGSRPSVGGGVRRARRGKEQQLLVEGGEEEEQEEAEEMGLFEEGAHDDDESEAAAEEESLPYMPTAEEDLEAKLAVAEEEAKSLEFLSKAVGERMLEEKYDSVRAPYKEPRSPKPLPYQLDLLSYYAKEALRARNTSEAVRIYERCACVRDCVPAFIYV